MAVTSDVTRVQEELVDALKWGEEDRARALLRQLGAGPRKIRAVLESMLAAPDALVRQAAVFGLGELGGAAIARRLEQQLALEEARKDYDGDSVADAITQTLGRIEEAGARTTLVRRLERLIARGADLSDVNAVARALWRKRHPDLLPAIREAMKQLAPPFLNSLHGLLLLLEKSPEALRSWVRDPSTPMEHKTEVLTVLEEEVPDPLISTLPSFISAAHALMESAVSQNNEAAYYCERLFVMLLLHREHLLPALPEEARSELRTVARSLVPAASPNCSFRAAVLLQFVGRPEDAAVIEANRPEDSVGAEAFDAIARALHSRQGQP
ncbi:hypothetical protein [Archangium sp.]|uniref:hypothetical protein n=1 Tax=Archangium sp. TaxID=1872627 RepID=UPI002D667468|nr:hypothetical protein [Archangium sp.]HYO55457.1 hypothetical protein [Archangium sp.]